MDDSPTERAAASRASSQDGSAVGGVWTRALTNGQVRLLCLGLALAQLVTGAGLLAGLPVAEGVRTHLWLAGASALVAAGAGVVFVRAWACGGPVRRAERDAVIALAAAPVIAMATAPWIVVWPVGGWGGGDVHVVWIIYGGLIALHAMPAGITALAVRGRIGTADESWGPHEASDADRGLALLGVSVLTGGWTAVLGIIGLSLLYNPGFPGADWLMVIAFYGAIAQCVGMVLGLFAATFSSTIPRPTRMNRSLPRIFLPAMAAGTVGAAIFPLLGIPAAGITLLISSLVVRRTCRLYPQGRCRSCNYDLAGLRDPVCPECGAAAEVG